MARGDVTAFATVLLGDQMAESNVFKGDNRYGPDPRTWSIFRKQGRSVALLLASVTALAGAFFFYLAGIYHLASALLAGCTTVALLALGGEVGAKIRKGDFGLDLIAALAMASALWFGEFLAGSIVATMYAGGQFLEAYAHRRADKGMSDLLAKVPRTALRITDKGLVEIAMTSIGVGDTLLIRRGDVIPVDCELLSEHALVEQALLTGEPLPVRFARNATILSGTSNAGDAIEIRALRRAEDSAYAGVVTLVEAAKRSRARMMRLADRYAIVFLLITLAIAGISAFMSGDFARVVAVLVVATPCPLILAVPVALAAGTTKAAREGVLVKGAGPLEALAGISVVVFDKTGTLTSGEPLVARIDGTSDPAELLRLAASLDQASSHAVARALLKEAAARRLVLTRPTDVRELPGAGISGIVDGFRVSVGGDSYVDPAGRPSSSSQPAGVLRARVSINGRLAGTIVLEDRLRNDAHDTIHALRELGISRFLLASGDEWSVARAIGATLGLDEVKARLTPAGKVEAIHLEQARGKVLMIGDGVNDAPALATADVGIAVGASNLAAAAEAADVVLIRDDLSRIPAAIKVARRARAIALQSVFAGMALSLVAMVVAGAGYLPPVTGAMLQEVIDVAVILNALRALS